MNGVMRAVVDDTRDPEGRGRIRIRYPGTNREAHAWARVVSPTTSADNETVSGIEPGDEVLVALESGNVRQPYILGKLSSRPDASPRQTPKAAIDPDTLPVGRPQRPGKPGHDNLIEIVDGTGENSVVIDPASNTVTVTGSQTVILQGQSVRIEAREIELDGEARISLRAPAIQINASASLETTSSGTMTIRGSLVKIN